MKKTTTEKINLIVQKVSLQTRKEVIEFAKKSFNDYQMYDGRDIKKELDEVLNTYSTENKNLKVAYGTSRPDEEYHKMHKKEGENGRSR